MNLDQKTTFAKKALDSIIDHDDAPMEEVKARFESIAAYATHRIAAAVLRRHEKAEAAKKLPPVTLTMREGAALTRRDVALDSDYETEKTVE
jgi:hypothetical protein